MLFHGKKLEAMATDEVAIPRPGEGTLFFKVRSIEHGEERKGDRMFPDPQPPHEFVTDAKKRPLRDPTTGKVQIQPNFQNPAYLSEAEKAERLQMVVAFVDALDQDPNIKWTNEHDRGSKAFYEACDAEIKEAGLTLGDIRLVLNKAMQLGNLDSDAIKRSAEAFSNRAVAE